MTRRFIGALLLAAAVVMTSATAARADTFSGSSVALSGMYDAYAADGSIAPYSCDATVDLHLTAGKPGADHVSPQRDANSANGLFRPFADGSPAFERAQTFTSAATGDCARCA
jgi:hypothetical protein